jgi:hypothetical protein
MKTFLIIFNNSRGNRDKFFEILSEGKMKIHEMINQIDNENFVYVTKIECDQNTFERLSKLLTGFCGS